VHLAALLTADITGVWLSDDIRDRLAPALGYFLDQLVSPAKRRNLKVRAA
jgi:hypothetical protein